VRPAVHCVVEAGACTATPKPQDPCQDDRLDRPLSLKNASSFLPTPGKSQPGRKENKQTKELNVQTSWNRLRASCRRQFGFYAWTREINAEYSLTLV